MKLTETLREPVLAEQLIRRWLSVAGFLAMAEIIAYWIGTQRTGTLHICAAIAAIVLVTVGMQDRAWILILLGWDMTSPNGSLPFGFSIHDICVLLTMCAYVAYRILTLATTQRKRHPLDVFLAINVVWIVITFVLHPVGFNVFGSDTVGARPYFNFLLALMAYRVIVRLPRSLLSVSRFPYFILAGTVVTAILNLVVYIVPSAAPYLYSFYGGLDLTSYINSTGAGSGEVQRFIGLRSFGFTLSLILAAYHEPRDLFNPMRPWFYALLLGLSAVLAAGFRSTCFGVMIMVAIAAWLRRGPRGVLIVVAIGGLLLGALVAGQGRAYELPFPVQRALSFVPGRWNEAASEQGQASTEGRLQWWKDVIKNDLIGDWWFGDGFGVSKRDYESGIGTASAKGGAALFDFFTRTGNFHSGPLTTIRYAGIIGFVLFYAFILAGAYYSVKCVQACRGTVLEPPAIFLAVQLIWIPFEYIFIFGAYDIQIREQTFLTALVLLLMRMSEAARKAANLTVSVAVPQSNPLLTSNLR